MKNILLCTDGSKYAQISYQYAVWIAQHMDVSIEVLYVTDIRKKQATLAGDLSGSIGVDAYQHLLEELVTLERQKAKINHEIAKVILDEAGKFLRENGVKKVHLTHRTGFLVDCFHEFEVDADLIILGKRGETAAFAPEHLGANMERIVRASHKPCFVSSGDFQEINRLLVAYDGSKSCDKALEAMVNLPAFKDLEVHLVNVVKHDSVEGLKCLEKAKQILLEGGFEPISQILRGDTEKAIAGYVEENKINLLIMGAYGHSRIRHLVIGSTTAQMLRSCKIPVLLFR